MKPPLAVDPCEGTTVGGGFLRGSRQGWWLPAREPPLMASPCEGTAAGDAPCEGTAINGGSLAGVRRQWRFPRKDPPPMVPPCRELPPMVPSRDPPPTVVPRRDPPPTVVPSQESVTHVGSFTSIHHRRWLPRRDLPQVVAPSQGSTTNSVSCARIHHQWWFPHKDPPFMFVSVAPAPAPYTWFLLLLNKPPTLRYGPGMSVTSQLRCPLTVQHGFRCPGTCGLHDLKQFYLRQRLRRHGANPLVLQVRVPSLQTLIVFTF